MMMQDDESGVISLHAAGAPAEGEIEAMLSDDDLFAPVQIVTRRVMIPPASEGGMGKGGYLLVKAPTSNIIASIGNATSEFREGKVVSTGDGNALYTLHCVVHPDGRNRFHGDDDYKRIRRWPALVTGRVAKAARELGGVTNADEKEERDDFA